MVGLIAAVAILMIFSTIVFQEWNELARREAEEEMMFRARELVRGIWRYRQDHAQVGPTKLEQLLEPGPRGQYYVRQLYRDPLVRDGKWGLLYLGPGGTIIDPTSQAATPEEQSLMDQLIKAPGAEAAGESGFAVVEGGGLTIAGVKSLCTDTPFRVYNGFTTYAEWRFSVLDIETGLASAVPGQGATPALPGSPTPVPSAAGGGFGSDPFGGGDRDRDRRERDRNKRDRERDDDD